MSVESCYSKTVKLLNKDSFPLTKAVPLEFCPEGGGVSRTPLAVQ